VLRSKLAWGGVVLVLLLAWAGYLAWSAYAAHAALSSAQEDAVELKQALLHGDRATAARSLRAFVRHTDAARERTDGWSWRVAEKTPFVGDDAAAVRRLADISSDLGHEARATQLIDGDTDVITTLTPKDGRVDLAAVRRVAPGIARLDTALTDAAARLAGVRAQGLTSWVRPSFEKFTTKLDSAHRAIASADRVAKVLPDLLGEGTPRNYLLRFNNNAEIRASGGMPGAWALLRADRGRLTMVRQGSAAVDFPEFPTPAATLTSVEQKIYGVQPAVYFQDTGFIPDFPRSADLVRAMWDTRFPDVKLDGVVEVDTVTMSRLLRATGPIEAPGVTLTADNAVDELLNRAYFRIPDPRQQDAFFATVARSIFDRFSTGVAAPAELFRGLGAAVDEGRVHVHVFEPQLQASVDGTAVAGAMDFSESRTPRLAIHLNDATGSKMSYYLRSSVVTTAARCDGGIQELHTVATFAEQDLDPAALPFSVSGGGLYGTPVGQQLVLVRIYGPAGGELDGFTFDGKGIDVEPVDDHGRPVAVTVVQLKPGQKTRVEWVTRTGQGQTGDAVQQLTPDLTARPYETTISSACG
jgi:hypothetical protein